MPKASSSEFEIEIGYKPEINLGIFVYRVEMWRKICLSLTAFMEIAHKCIITAFLQLINLSFTMHDGDKIGSPCNMYNNEMNLSKAIGHIES